MATSVLDYVFRELAINYLGRHDLAQVIDDDLSSSSLGSTPEITEEVEQPDGNFVGIPSAASTSRLAENDGGMKKASTSTATEEETLSAEVISRAKGYTGDPCPECGSLTMVRNGTCLRCDSCGATTGCS